MPDDVAERHHRSDKSAAALQRHTGGRRSPMPFGHGGQPTVLPPTDLDEARSSDSGGRRRTPVSGTSTNGAGFTRGTHRWSRESPRPHSFVRPVPQRHQRNTPATSTGRRGMGSPGGATDTRPDRRRVVLANRNRVVSGITSRFHSSTNGVKARTIRRRTTRHTTGCWRTRVVRFAGCGDGRCGDQLLGCEMPTTSGVYHRDPRTPQRRSAGSVVCHSSRRPRIHRAIRASAVAAAGVLANGESMPTSRCRPTLVGVPRSFHGFRRSRR
jgi:hypothetical protein